MADGKFFSTTKKGEVAEYKQDLHSADRKHQKNAVKRVIAAMTVGKDVSSLFPDVVNCMQTDDMELKKLVYLYLINYAKTQPDLAIMAVNTFVKDTQDPNPLIRSLAVRTMGCIRVDKITEYLCDPLARCLKDEDPYVRKTAAVCVAKLYDISPELVEDRGFLDTLKALLGDANPMVVANAVAALAEITESSGEPALRVTPGVLHKLLRALNECTEWGQVFILDALSTYTPADAKEAEGIAERVTPRLQHANGAVVLGAVRLILHLLPHLGEAGEALARKLAPPLVTLLGAEPEVQYVALRSISLIVAAHPAILARDVKVFFCKYNDPIYVKTQKLDIMIRLVDESSVDQVLLELREYASEVDVEFVQRAVRAIGSCAVAVEPAAQRCVSVLLELVQTRVSYVVQEAVVVIKDIFRRYPNRFESVIGTLCDNLDALDEPEAKASMVWIVGEYAERIDNADELLEQFLETFPEETAGVQLALLTATVKLFLKRPAEKAQQLIQLVLTFATQETDNPDLRDRAYIYWRLLSSDPEAAKDVVLAEKPVISGVQDAMDPALLQELLAELGSLAAVYHRPAATFATRARLAVQRADELAARRAASGTDEGVVGGSSEPGTARGAPGPAPPAPVPDLLGDLLDLGGDDAGAAGAAPAGPAPAGGVLDLLGSLDIGGAAPAAAAPPPHLHGNGTDPFSKSSGVVDLFGGDGAQTPQIAAAASLPVILPAERGQGLTVRGRVVRGPQGPEYSLAFENGTGRALEGFMLQLNKNGFGLVPANQVIPISSLAPHARAQASVPLSRAAAQTAPGAPGLGLQVAFRVQPLGVLYSSDSLPLQAVLAEDGRIAGEAFVAQWMALPQDADQPATLPAAVSSVEAATAALAAARLFVLAHKVAGAEQVLFVTGRCEGGAGPAQLLLELRFHLGHPGVRVVFKAHGEAAALKAGAIAAVGEALA